MSKESFSGGGEETRGGDQFLEADQPAAEGPAGGDHITEEIETMVCLKHQARVKEIKGTKPRTAEPSAERKTKSQKNRRSMISLRYTMFCFRFNFIVILQIAILNK